VLDHAPGLVITDHTDEGNIMADRRVKLHGIEAEGAVARYDDDGFIGPRHFSPDSEWYARSQATEKASRTGKNKPLFLCLESDEAEV